MIAKGTTHNNGVKLARYMTTGKDGERAELWQLRGFASDDITEAFRTIHVMAEATKCEQPLFHVQVRNREGETLTRKQWEITVNRIERMLGLNDQPRAMAFHIDEQTGHEHMHVTWSRIDGVTLTAKHLPFFKERLKKISRELELHFGLPTVRNERDSPIKFAPTRAEHEQARRLGLDIHEIRDTIRDCFDRSDCGRSFQAALADKALTLTEGDRRGYVVIDQEGGIHALGKRILDVTAARLKAHLSDLAPDQLPTVETARMFVIDLKPEKQQEQPVPVWDRELADRTWQSSIVNAAIEKEKIDRQFAEPRKRNGQGTGSREKEVARPTLEEERHWPITPPQPKSQSRLDYWKAAREATGDHRTENLKGEPAKLWSAWRESDSPKAFAAALDDKGISLAVVTPDEAYRSHREATFAYAIGNRAPRYNAGEIVIITEPRPEYRRSGDIFVPQRIHKIDQALAEKIAGVTGTRSGLQGIDATLQASDNRAQQRAADRDTLATEWATRPRGFPPTRLRGRSRDNIKSPAAAAKAAVKGVGKVFDVLSSLADGILSPILTPEQIRAGERATQRREAEAENSIDHAQYVADLTQQRQQQENDREAARRQRDRDRGDRER